MTHDWANTDFPPVLLAPYPRNHGFDLLEGTGSAVSKFAAAAVVDPFKAGIRNRILPDSAASVTIVSGIGAHDTGIFLGRRNAKPHEVIFLNDWNKVIDALLASRSGIFHGMDRSYGDVRVVFNTAKLTYRLKKRMRRG